MDDVRDSDGTLARVFSTPTFNKWLWQRDHAVLKDGWNPMYPTDALRDDLPAVFADRGLLTGNVVVYIRFCPGTSAGQARQQVYNLMSEKKFGVPRSLDVCNLPGYVDTWIYNEEPVSIVAVNYNETAYDFSSIAIEEKQSTEHLVSSVIQEALAGDRGREQQLIAEEGLKWVETLLRKNRDYGGSVFKTPVLAPECSVGTSIRVRMSDKIERLCTLLTKESSEVAESIDDTFDDLGAYALLRKVAVALEKEVSV